MIKVCHMTSAHNSDDDRIYHKECTSLAAAGYDTYLVAGGECREENGVHVIGIGIPPVSRFKRMTAFAKRIYEQALSLDAEIYHIHDPELLPYGLKLQKRGKKVIFDSHENTLEQMEEKYWIPAMLRGVVSKAYRNYATKAFRKYDCLISVTPHIVEQLAAINWNTWMITNYPLYKEYMQRDQGTSCFSVCFTGGIDTQWNHSVLLDAISNIDNVTYNLCGWGSEKYLDALKRHSAWKKVNFFGKVSFERSTEVQLASSVGLALLQPTKNTGNMIGTLGNVKLFEYMMAGLPVICTDFILWKKFVEKWRCGLCIRPDDAASVANAIIYLRDNPEEARKMGENGRHAVEKEFNWDTQAAKLMELYKSLIDRKTYYIEHGELI